MNSCSTVAFIWSPRQLLQSDTGVPHFALDPLTYRCLLSLSPAADFAEPRPPRHIPFFLIRNAFIKTRNRCVFFASISSENFQTRTAALPQRQARVKWAWKRYTSQMSFGRRRNALRLYVSKTIFPVLSRAVVKSTFVESKTSPSPKRFESESSPSPKRFESESSPSPKRFESKSKSKWDGQNRERKKSSSKPHT